ncbi:MULTISPECIES: protein-methionine-sulfoxide reductase catalytic subunit MsrP [unclassified Polynucleobacter]|uniref:protein-methionine-sulfoxide reductase catalytic subunit MsrP n=1 Tax=unclassified Polynucleobacter TaxID=2640945 RepID=UPI0025746BF1|nr:MULTISPECIES: protein-methionine-sulfoxide reductase catalytic subunit MsrP [unclassified Polynucleobacter]BEI42763.1 protein-methionine-sulfoxide reductase catalytic subunit MsrP [Polynucleobacter sp. HIN10]BEI44517.1 protein-methionine-sulfoxide reductase catalytic subunit MsrP [Polynucleobacter sp. HIN11]
MIFKDPRIHPSQITPRAIVENRRQWLKTIALGSAAVGMGSWLERDVFAKTAAPREKLPSKLNEQYSTRETQTSYEDATTYNNFYEFGMDKDDPAKFADRLQTRPWTVSIEGMVKKPVTLDIDALLKLAPMEERVYRLRCVEGWSMVIPWNGYALSHLLNRVEPLGSAKYVEFISLADPKQMPGLKRPVLDWPYREGLRMDEAMNPLTLLTFGMYGELLPKQNGAPIRLIVPWKYGFKSSKSLVTIRLTEKQPLTSWSASAPREYGFYSNVNPAVSHPRWSQATERRIDGRGIFAPKIKTEPFNGYGEYVAKLYAGMDLRKFY